jgi:hypothetical protein
LSSNSRYAYKLSTFDFKALQFHAFQVCGLHTRAWEHDSLQSHAVDVQALPLDAIKAEAIKAEAIKAEAIQGDAIAAGAIAAGAIAADALDLESWPCVRRPRES